MSEARKYHLNLIVANQFTTQLTEEIRDAVFGNMGTIVTFRIGQNDVESLSRYFQPLFDGDDLLRVPNYNTIVRTLISGVPTQPFSMATLPPLGDPHPELGGALKQLSAAKFGRPRQVVEKEIFGRLKTEEPMKTAYSAPSPADQAKISGQSAGASQDISSKANASFLDQWMDKRRQSKPTQQSGSINPPIAQAQPVNSNLGTVNPAQQPIPKSQQSVNPATFSPSAQASVASPKNDSQPIASSPQPAVQTNEGEFRISRDQPVAVASGPQEEDTIYIDRDGNLGNSR